MRARRILVAALAWACCASPPPSAFAQSGGPYTLSRGNVSGGGTRSAGGAYVLDGAAGQPDAAPVAGGAYALNGGFLPPLAPGATDVEPAPTPRAFVFRAPAPNPSRGRVEFAIELPTPGRVTLAVYAVDGRLVRTLLDAERGTGFHRATWDGLLSGGARAAAGVYFARANAAGAASTHRFVLLD